MPRERERGERERGEREREREKRLYSPMNMHTAIHWVMLGIVIKSP